MFQDFIKQGQVYVADNAATLLAGTAVAGVVTTAVLTGRASVKAAELIRELEEEYQGQLAEENGHSITLTTQKKVQVVWPQFVPPVLAGVTTISAIIFSHRIATSKSAALATAYAMSDKAFSEYKEKVLEKVGVKKEEAIRDEVAKAQIEDKPIPTTLILVEGEVLCYDSYTGRFFRSNMETIRKAENDINADIQQHSYASLGDFYEKIGLAQTDITEDLGWNINNILIVEYSTQLAEDGRPCIVITFQNSPDPDYQKVYGL